MRELNKDGGSTNLRNEESKNILYRVSVDILKATKESVMIEIGCYKGESTSAFADAFGTVYAIDPWINGMDLIDGTTQSETFFMTSDVEPAFDKVVEEKQNIKKIKAFDYDVIDDFEDESIDFIYIDAIHTRKEVEEQIKRWLPKIKPEGWIGGHDFSFQFLGVIAGVYNILGTPSFLLRDDGTSWIKKLSEPIKN